ncbi:TonB-dependent receptor [Undibacterium sp. TS12]|uniref:TonB-dependent receptor plug domain-containing protein n=1 Tax=Undibacterium sp. TS12 TaxID=2908202 RepID=UPI001F4C822C|nr:TonB-dependent receptor [Undibacterium sp. TS12]MCH8619128.1 TonB-dependent receptor [Undibacterium sp. TS12]
MPCLASRSQFPYFFASCLTGFLARDILAADLPLTSKGDIPAVQTVEVTGPGAVTQRKNDTAAKIVISNAELLQYGDNQLSAVLKRQPGVSVVGNELRLRGLGAGYTQILLNGDPVAPGFSLDSITPEMIERVEILRTTTAEFSAQAVAGTINIIMKKALSQARKEFKLGIAHGENNWNPSLSMEVSDQYGGLSYSLTGALSRTGYENNPVVEELVYDDHDALNTQRLIRQKNLADFLRLGLTPRLNWKLDNGDTISWQSLLDFYRNVNWGADHETLTLGQHTQYPDNHYRASSHLGMLRSDVNWAHRIDADSKLNAKLGLNYNKRETDYQFYGYPELQQQAFNRHVVSNAIDSSLSSSGKYLNRFFETHSLALGWDATQTQRSEVRLQYDSQPGVGKIDELDEEYRADVRRLALFAQDEWDVSERLQAYLGLRWEGLKTDTTGRLMSAVQTRSSVWSPVMQLLWKLPDQDKDQLRFALSRTYKAPLTRNLVPRRYTANNDNGPNNPDFQGNPELLPELAWGADLAYESYFAKDSMLSISAYAKRVQDVTVRKLYQQNGVWITSPFNQGRAQVFGLEIDAKFALSGFLKDVPPLEVRINVARNWSRLDAIPGPDNRLSEQVPLTGNLGLDYRRSARQSMGLNMNIQTGGTVQQSTGLRTYSSVNRNLDVYALWKMENKTQLRLSATNLLHQDVLQASQYSDAQGRVIRSSTTPASASIKLTLEKGW